MEIIRSRQNTLIRTFRELAANAELRYEEGIFVCDGDKLLAEALRSSAEVQTVLWKEERKPAFPVFPEEFILPSDLYDYASPMKNSPGPLFTVKMRRPGSSLRPTAALVLEGVQDPGNVGTILRTADAFHVDAIILLENCADLYSPKTVRASMGAVFRQNAYRMSRDELSGFCAKNSLQLYGAALSVRAKDIRTIDLKNAAVAIGSEGKGLSRELLELCDGEVVIPMSGEAESLNAAVAAAIVMWQMQG